jgi:hypothetical protein
MSELCGCASVKVINLLGMECHDGIMGNGIMGARDQTMMMRPMRCDAMRCDAMRANSNRQHFFSSLIKTSKQHLNRQVTGKPYYLLLGSMAEISANLLIITTKFRPQVTLIKMSKTLTAFGPTTFFLRAKHFEALFSLY